MLHSAVCFSEFHALDECSSQRHPRELQSHDSALSLTVHASTAKALKY